MADFPASLSLRSPPTSTSAVFSLPSSDSSDSGADNDQTPLPFPAALPRSDFLAPDFQPAAYLSALPHRHQTLEDLRSDLRERSAAISAELLELVNSNYTAFLTLGTELRGGEEKIGDVKVALLGFRRAVEEVKSKVSARRDESGTLNDELHDVRTEIEQGRKMIEVSERLSYLEERLALDSVAGSGGKGDLYADDDDEEEDDDDSSDSFLGSSPAKLSTSASECTKIETLLKGLEISHPFTIKLEERLIRCQNTLLLDLGHAVKEARSAGAKGQDRLMKYLLIYRRLGAQDEAIKIFRNK